MASDLLERYTGCLLGLACGDALGAPAEFLAPAEIASKYGVLRDMMGGGWLEITPGDWTDDTAMMLCLAESIADLGEVDPADVAQRFLSWHLTNPPDEGNITRRALEGLRQGVTWDAVGWVTHQSMGGMSAGNGSLMRCAPVALFDRRDCAALIQDSRDTSVITHFDERAGWSCAALNLAIAHLLEGECDGLLEWLLPQVEEPAVKACLAAVPARTAAQLHTGGYVLDTLESAFWCFLNTSGFEEAVVRVVNLGGDADTAGAVCGALAGAWYGVGAIPERWLGPLAARERITALAERLHELSAR